MSSEHFRVTHSSLRSGKRRRSAFKKAVFTILRYLLGAGAGVGALWLRSYLHPFLGERNPYHTVWLAVVFSAWYCGVGPAIVTVIIGAMGVWYWFLPPAYSFFGKDRTEISGVIGFLIFSAIVIIFGEFARRSIVRREKAEEELRDAQEDLEQRVRERTAALEQRTAEVIEKAMLLDLANDAIFIKTKIPKDTITYWNQGAERLYGWTAREAMGRNPSELLHATYPIPLEEIEKHEVWEGELTHSTRDGRRIVVASRWTALRNKHGDPVGWMEINTDITDRKRAEKAARSLSVRILTLQDDEHRRIARALHDSLGQYLAALKMQLGLLTTSGADREQLISEASDIVDRCLAETRTVSHLLHPPLLDEAGFGSAARWFVEGFAERSGIAVTLDLPPTLPRLPAEIEIALFRALQEALTNVHRHAFTPKVDIRLALLPNQIRMEIQDYGQGIPSDVLRHLGDTVGKTGIGLAGMRERVHELGGSLNIHSDRPGTLLTIGLPFANAAESAPVEEPEPKQISAA